MFYLIIRKSRTEDSGWHENIENQEIAYTACLIFVVLLVLSQRKFFFFFLGGGGGLLQIWAPQGLLFTKKDVDEACDTLYTLRVWHRLE